MPRGSCLCGKVTYEYQDAVMKALCHCLTCRKVTGTSFATTILVPEASLKSNAEPPKLAHTTHESGMGLHLYGCDVCPSMVYKTADGFPGMKVVFAGTLDGDQDISTEGKPEGEIWVKHRVPWLKPLDDCVQHEGWPSTG